LLRHALNRTPPDHNEFAHHQMFAADLERFLTLCEAGPGDHVYFPTAYGRDALAALTLVARVGAERLPTFHLEYRHAMLSPAELDRETNPFRAFHTRTHRAYFDACRAHPETPKVRFYTDTAELAGDYAALAGFAFDVLPIPFRASLIPSDAPAPSASRCGYSSWATSETRRDSHFFPRWCGRWGATDACGSSCRVPFTPRSAS
jgi:hypothetical protein